MTIKELLLVDIDAEEILNTEIKIFDILNIFEKIKDLDLDITGIKNKLRYVCIASGIILFFASIFFSIVFLFHALNLKIEEVKYSTSNNYVISSISENRIEFIFDFNQSRIF